MEGSPLFEHERIWYPFAFFGIKHPLTAINLTTVFNTWVALIVIFVLVFIARTFVKKQNSLGQYLIKSFVRSFVHMIEQSTGIFTYRYFSFITSMFIFIICCNWVALIPTIEEPTKDLNTTLSLGIIAFLYIQKEMIRVHGLLNYLKDYFMPVNIMFPLNLIAGLIMLPLKVLGEVASVISISFRLFGNIFGGSIITAIFQQAVSGSILLNFIGTFLGINLILIAFFIIFEGFLQAFVFSILSLTNIAMAVQIEHPEGPNGT
jgi:F-type H+-transporting ATPase subunit a